MSINNKIIIKESKTLKLNNVLIRTINENEFTDLNKVIYMIENYIKSKGNRIIGPRIKYSSLESYESGQAKLTFKLMVQLENPIINIEEPYEYKNQIKVANCLFARFQEKEENIKFAYSKLFLYAFENDIKLIGDNYTVYVDKKEHHVVADIFMEIQATEVK